MNGMRVLAVDDNLTFTVFLLGKLGEFGYVIERVASGERAIERLQSREAPPVDLVLLDQVMGAMSGFETFTKMRELGLDVPTIMITGHSSITLAVEFLKAGGSDYMEKPISSFDILDVKIRNAIERFKARKTIEEGEAIRRACALKTAFLTNVSHDVRSHLSGASMCVKFAEKYLGPNGNEKTRDFLKKARQANDAVLELLGNTLTLSRLESGSFDYAFEEGDLCRIVRQAASQFEVPLSENGISIEFREDSNTKVVSLDPGSLSRVFSNLIGNAMKFSECGGHISISVTEDADSVTVGITDDGIGIPDAEVSTIFDRFARSTRSRRTKEGTGLGLAICREIVLAHKGLIWAENNRSGKGSTFYVRLPKWTEAEKLVA